MNTTAVEDVDLLVVGGGKAGKSLAMYRAKAGIVMRCPHCANALVTIVKDDSRVWIGYPGVRTLQVTV